MKPAIYACPHKTGCVLVDEDSENRMRWKSHGHRRSFETAIEIGRLKPGQFEIHAKTAMPADRITGDCPWTVLELNETIVTASPEVMNVWPEGKFIHAPAICVHSPDNSDQPEYFHEHRTSYGAPRGRLVCHGIHIEAAVVMLRLAASWNNFKYDRVTETRSFGNARIESTGPSLPWCKWSFLCAWLWSDWEARSHPHKLTIAQRFEEMKAAGYPSGIKAFEAMHRRLFPKPTH